jgi:pyridoxamine 5'-phosphate oxidase
MPGMNNPLEEFASWYVDAQKDSLANPNIVALATATAEGRPSVRMVFFRGIREGGFSFFTNYESRKGVELQANPWASMVFHWPHQGRQVRVEGAVERLSAAESDAYFQSRPFESQITTLVSRQSRPMQDPDAFRLRLAELEQTLRGTRISRPENWGGFKILPCVLEFWSRGEHRRHERVFYKKADEWNAMRLYP